MRFFCLSAVLILAGPVQAQTYLLSEPPLGATCYRLEVAMDLKGKINVVQDGKAVSFPLTASARHDYLERILAEKDSLASKSARYYNTAMASLNVDGKPVDLKLRPDNRLLVAQRLKDETIAYSPKMALTEEERELLDHFDTLNLAGLLPGKAAKVGDSWKLGNNVAQSLCDFEGLLDQNLTGTLTGVQGSIAQVNIAGNADGIVGGAKVKILVKATAHFDLKFQRVVQLDWKQSDQREQGPVSPGLSADVNILVKRTLIPEPEQLNNFALVPVPSSAMPPEEMTRLVFKDDAKRFEFHYGRDWRRVAVKNDQVVLRLMDRGDFVAQVTLMPWKKADPSKLMSVDEFESLMENAPGWKQEAVLEKNPKVEAAFGNAAYRVSASGLLDGQKVHQFFYFLASPAGEQMFITFTLNPNQVEKLAARDMRLLRSVLLPGSERDAALQLRGN